MNINEAAGMARTVSSSLSTVDLPWVEKYRPNELENVVSQEDITHTLRTFINKVCKPDVFVNDVPELTSTYVVPWSSRDR